MIRHMRPGWIWVAASIALTGPSAGSGRNGTSMKLTTSRIGSAGEWTGCAPTKAKRAPGCGSCAGPTRSPGTSRSGGLERRLDELAIELAIAEARLEAELTTDSTEFAAAVQAELIAWNTYIDALQAIAATSHEHARPRREAVIRRVRQRRGDVRQQLQEFWDASGSPSVIPRIRVSAALDGLDQAADEAAAEFG